MHYGGYVTTYRSPELGGYGGQFQAVNLRLLPTGDQLSILMALQIESEHNKALLSRRILAFCSALYGRTLTGGSSVTSGHGEQGEAQCMRATECGGRSEDQNYLPGNKNRIEGSALIVRAGQWSLGNGRRQYVPSMAQQLHTAKWSFQFNRVSADPNSSNRRMGTQLNSGVA